MLVKARGVGTATVPQVVILFQRGIVIFLCVVALTLPEVRTRLDGLGMEVNGGAPDAFGKVVAADVTKWARVVKEASIKID